MKMPNNLQQWCVVCMTTGITCVILLSGCSNRTPPPQRGRVVTDMNVDCGSHFLDAPGIAPLRPSYDPVVKQALLTPLRATVEKGMTMTNAVEALLGLGLDLELYFWTSDFGQARRQSPRYAVAIHRLDRYTELVFRFEQMVHEPELVLFSAYVRRVDGNSVWLEGPLLTKGNRKPRYETAAPGDIPKEPQGELRIDEMNIKITGQTGVLK